MERENQISGLCKLGQFIADFLSKKEADYSELELQFFHILQKAELANSWFTIDNQKFALEQWSNLLTENNLNNWLKNYDFNNQPKKIGLILAGNIPLVGLHDILCVVLSGHNAMIKLSSKDQILIPFLIKIWSDFAQSTLPVHFVERLENYDAVIATGSNNTAKYLEYYFKNVPNIIRRNRTSVAIITGNETHQELQDLAKDIFIYFGLGCRNVTHLFIPKEYDIHILFDCFLSFSHLINHHQYANNYEYNRAIYLLNQDQFWDNNFVMLKEDQQLFSPLSVIHFSRFQSIEEVQKIIVEKSSEIQTIVANSNLDFNRNVVNFGESQKPSLDTYADDVDTLTFLTTLSD